MLKSSGNKTLEDAEVVLQKMEYYFFKLSAHIKGHASYYNHMDISIPGIDVYFRNGVETNPSISESDKDYWVNRLANVRREYNDDGMLSNLRPCCESSLDESSGLCEEPKGKVPIDFGNGNIRRKKCKGYKKHRQWNCDYKEVKDACPISCKICTP